MLGKVLDFLLEVLRLSFGSVSTLALLKNRLIGKDFKIGLEGTRGFGAIFPPLFREGLVAIFVGLVFIWLKVATFLACRCC